MADFTPGPWYISQSPSEPRIAFVMAPDSRPIADVWNVPHTKGAQALADALLISSAPELLAALQALYDRSSMEHWPVEHEMARAAIAKAVQP